MTEIFQFSDRAKKVFLGMIGVGVVGILIAIIFYGENQHSRLWSNLLLNTYYFTGIALSGLFLATAHQVGYGGWHVLLKKLMTSFSAFLPYTFGFVLLILVFLFIGKTNLYHHWAHPSPDDTIVAGKAAYLNLPFFTIRIVIYFALWLGLAYWFRKLLRQEDIKGDRKLYQKIKNVAAIFLVIFAVSSSMVSWDLIMSLDPHWYSTLFGWYNFASYMVAALAFMILITIYLKSRGYLKQVNENHVHDLGKLMFGFSVFYTYLWFSQYLLIWYGNIPEDTAYFIKRFDIPFFKALFFITFIVNFIMPMLVLMTRKSKRSFSIIAFMSVVLIGGHYLDFYLMVMPEPNMASVEHHIDHNDHADGHAAVNADDAVLYADAAVHSSTDKHNDLLASDDKHAAAGHGVEEGHEEQTTTYAGLGIVELFIFLGFVGGFLYIVFNALSKESLIPVNDPYLIESIQHHS